MKASSQHPMEIVRQRRSDWQALAELLDRPSRSYDGAAATELSERYRSVAADLMRLRALDTNPSVIDYLDTLTARAHDRLYELPTGRAARLFDLLFRGFPAALATARGALALSAALLFVPLLGVLGLTLWDSEFATHFVSRAELAQFVSMYRDDFGGRGSGADNLMTGFYIQHNISIAFRVFATGIFFGIGSVFFLVYNGVAIGATVGYVVAEGAGENILTFICGHGPFELLSFVVAGAAGLTLGHALLETGGLTRWGSVRARSTLLVQLVVGAFAMCLVAAFIEGQWSASSLPNPVKWVGGAVSALLVGLWMFRPARASRRGERS